MSFGDPIHGLQPPEEFIVKTNISKIEGQAALSINPVWSTFMMSGMVSYNLLANMLLSSFWSMFNKVLGLYPSHSAGQPAFTLLMHYYKIYQVSAHVPFSTAQLKAVSQFSANSLISDAGLVDDPKTI